MLTSLCAHRKKELRIIKATERRARAAERIQQIWRRRKAMAADLQERVARVVAAAQRARRAWCIVVPMCAACMGGAGRLCAPMRV